MSADEVVTLTVRGEGGHIFEMDRPREGSMRREIFDSMVSKGLIEILPGEDAKPARAKTAPAKPQE